MKKTLSILLAALLLCGVMGVTASAAAPAQTTEQASGLTGLLLKPLTDFIATYDLENLTDAQLNNLIGILTTLKTLGITDPHGYVDTWMTFPATGWVRLQWTYPSSDSALKSTMITNSNGTIYSRTVGVSFR